MRFYSMTDEDMFFIWIKAIPCIESFEGARDELYLDLVNRDLEYSDIRDLIALLRRYHIDRRQIDKFINDKNKNHLCLEENAFLVNDE